MKRVDTGEGEKVQLNTGRLKAVEKAAEEATAHPEPLRPAPRRRKPAPADEGQQA